MKTLKELIAKVLDINEEELNDNSSPENISSWDSFKGLMLVSELEKNFNVKFTMNEVISIKNFGDIKKLIKKYGIIEGINN